MYAYQVFQALHGAYIGTNNKKPSLKGWAKYLIQLVPAAGFELAT